MMKRIVIRHGRILDIETGRADLADMLIEDGTIKMIGAPDMTAPGDAEVIDAADRLLVPGLVNGHTHAHGGLGKGLVGDRVPLEMFLSASMAMNGRRSAEDKYLSAALSAVEMVRRGCTAAYDLVVEFPLPSVEGIDAVAQAYHDVGMRAVVAPMMADRSLYQALPGLMEAMPDKLEGDLRRIVGEPYQASVEAGATTGDAFARRWPLPSHCTAPMSFGSLAAISLGITTSGCRRISRKQNRRLRSA